MAQLRQAGCVFAEEEAALLLEAALDDPARLAELVAHRVAGLPLEQVLGWAEFCGLRIAIDPGVFVPRRRTEFLVDRATHRAEPGMTVVDLCCGSGAIAAALAHRQARLEVYAADLDPACVACARRNLNTTRVFAGDLFDALPDRLRGQIDIVTANTPYVPTEAIALMPPEARLHEPRLALDGGPDGLDLQRRLAADSGAWLRPGGHLLVQTSDDQADAAAAIFISHGLSATIEHSEEYDATVIVGTWPG